jgi:ABC-type proline/glycine betaine transport system substrate-binding protein
MGSQDQARIIDTCNRVGTFATNATDQKTDPYSPLLRYVWSPLAMNQRYRMPFLNPVHRLRKPRKERGITTERMMRKVKVRLDA